MVTLTKDSDPIDLATKLSGTTGCAKCQEWEKKTGGKVRICPLCAAQRVGVVEKSAPRKRRIVVKRRG